MSLEALRKKISTGERLDRDDGIALFRSPDLLSLGRLASRAAEQRHGRNVYFIQNMHINPTNLCVNRCRFCAFSRSRGEDGAYELTIEDILARARRADPGVREFHIVSGLHPDLPFSWYLELLQALKREYPQVHLKAFTAVEIDHLARIAKLDLRLTLEQLRDAGLGSLPGGGAEIFVPAVRKTLCAEKISGDRWIEVMETAHGLGIRSNATMLYGHIESIEDRVDHLLRLRELQDRTGGFQAFIPLSFHAPNTEITKTAYTTGFDDLRTMAVSRLLLDNFDHIKAYWIMLGEKLTQVALSFGADDIDGTVVEERITRMAGGTTEGAMTREELIRLIRRADRTAVERDTVYNTVRIWS